jgi:hypothetical protein
VNVNKSCLIQYSQVLGLKSVKLLVDLSRLFPGGESLLIFILLNQKSSSSNLVNSSSKFRSILKRFSSSSSQKSATKYIKSLPLFTQINSPWRKTLKSIYFPRRREKHETFFQNGRNWNSSRERIIRLYAVPERKFALKVYCGDNEPALDSYLPRKDHSLESNECTLHAQQR